MNKTAAAQRSPVILILRPEPGAGESVRRARELGLAAHAFPLFAVHALSWIAPPRDTVDALVLGSANALRHAGPALDAYRGLPAYAVGEKTARAAQAAGLDVVVTGHGGLQTVLGMLDPGHRRLLRLAGRERVTLSLPAGVTMETREVYASQPVPPPEGLLAALEAPCIVLLHSGEAARRFEALCTQREIARNHVHVVAIAARVCEPLAPGWASQDIAAEPSDTALLALAARMCQDMRSGSTQADNQP